MTITAQGGKAARTSVAITSKMIRELGDHVVAEQMRHDPSWEPGVPLAQVLTYVNTAVVNKIEHKLNLSPEDAQQLFEDMLRFLWLSAMFGNVQPTTTIDEAWHLFILFTRDYRNFCEQFFGEFIDHRPHYPNDPPNDGSTGVRTATLIARYLGATLSKNWEDQAACGGCTSKCKDRCRCQ